jgi:hypothetical protein
MTREQAVEAAADKYRTDGYEVTIPPPEQVASGIDLVARRGGETVAVQVKLRTEWYHVPAEPRFPTLPPDWRFDLVVLPANEPGDVAPPGPPPAEAFAESLLNEFDELLPRGAFRARALLAWAALEAALRVAARREQLGLDLAPTREVIRELVTAGVLSHNQYDRLREISAVRNRIAHGLPVEAAVQPEDATYLAELARSLLTSQPAATAS